MRFEARSQRPPRAHEAGRSGVGSNAAAAAAATVIALAAVSALHALRRDLEPASHRLSEYAIGPWGWLMTLAFVAVATGVWLLRRALPASDALRPVRTLLTVAASGFVVSAVSRPIRRSPTRCARPCTAWRRPARCWR